jgi:3-phenylpropionate/cinnamic acid dioxygenase small subunit
MAQKCSICIHPKRAYINRMLLNAKNPLREIAGKYGVSQSAVDRHRAHISNAVQVAKTNGDIVQGKTAYEQYVQMRDEAERMYRKSKGFTQVAWFREWVGMLDRAYKYGMEAERQREKQEFKDVTPDVLDIINAVKARAAEYEVVEDES